MHEEKPIAEADVGSWDLETDVAVVGLGCAGACGVGDGGVADMGALSGGDRLIDLSEAAMKRLDAVSRGLVEVSIYHLGATLPRGPSLN